MSDPAQMDNESEQDFHEVPSDDEDLNRAWEDFIKEEVTNYRRAHTAPPGMIRLDHDFGKGPIN